MLHFFHEPAADVYVTIFKNVVHAGEFSLLINNKDRSIDWKYSFIVNDFQMLGN